MPGQKPADLAEGHADKGKEGNRNRFLQSWGYANPLRLAKSPSDQLVTITNLPESGPDNVRLLMQVIPVTMCTNVESTIYFFER